MEDLGIDGNIILKCVSISKKDAMTLWAVLVWVWIRTLRGILWIRLRA